jgi:putative nucleotidyltransferase with HDIG domain
MSAEFEGFSLLSPTVSVLIERIRPALTKNTPLYLVGGSVRDVLLKRVSHDLDFALAGNAIRTARHVADLLKAAFYPLHEEFDAGRVIFYEPDGRRYTLDFTSLRGPDLESDLRGRDFTINAMAVDIHDLPNKLLDPLNGVVDLRYGRIRACSPRALSDDPIRILRAIRQAVEFRFQIVPDTRQLIYTSIPDLAQVSPERLRDELFRMLSGPQPHVAFRLIDTLGVLPYLTPELPALKGVSQPPPHIYDIWNHTLEVLKTLEALLEILRPDYVSDPDVGYSRNLILGLAVMYLGRYRQQIYDHLKLNMDPELSLKPILFLAALYHDAGKPSTSKMDETGRIRFLEHEIVGAQMVGERGRALHLSNREITRLQTIIRNHMRPLLLSQAGENPTRRAIYRFYRDTGEVGVDICLLFLADLLAAYGHTLPQGIWVRSLEIVRKIMDAWWEKHETQVAPPPLVSGYDLIEIFSLKPSIQIGKLLESVREAQAIGEISNRDEALIFIQKLLERM